MTIADLAQKLIEQEEGRVAHVYADSRKLWTIGIGCLVDPSVPGAGLCDEAIDVQFAHDSARARKDATDLPGFQRCNEVRQAVLISMCFQLGSLQGWPKFKAAIALGDFELAAIYGLDSAWARQTPARAQRQMKLLRTGEWE
jgi:lysozyme